MSAEDKKLYLVTGGGRGIGRAICKSLSGPDSVIIINYRENRTAAEETLEMVGQRGGAGELYQCDITDYKAVRRMFQTVTEKYHAVDALINNAGILLERYLYFTTEEEWRHVIDTNLNGAFYCIKCALPDMVKRECGKIINISSMAASRMVEGCAAYTASKCALNGLTRALALEVRKYNITVNAICSGFVETDMTRAYKRSEFSGEPFGSPEDIAAWVKFLLGGESRFMTGGIITVDGGASL